MLTIGPPLLHSKYPELFQWFKEFLGYKDSSPMESVASFKERTSGELHHLEIGMRQKFLLFILTTFLTIRFAHNNSCGFHRSKLNPFMYAVYRLFFMQKIWYKL